MQGNQNVGRSMMVSTPAMARTNTMAETPAPGRTSSKKTS